jgi:rubrerythrin
MNGAEKKRILEILRLAMITESDGHSFYTMAAMAMKDEKGQEYFKELANEENRHFDWLKLQRSHIVEHDELDQTLVTVAPDDLVAARKIFSPELRKRIATARFEMSALSIGMTLELNSIKYYEALAEKEPIPEAKEFYLNLAAWEKQHYDSLFREYDDLKADYWAKAGFAPIC